MWAVLAAFCAFAVFGFIHEHLFGQELWKSGGLERFGGFTALYWAAAALVLWLRPAWLLPIAAGCAVLYAQWWCWQFADPLAPAAVIFFLGSCWALGRIVTREAAPVFALLIGLAIWIFLISLAVHFPINRPWVYAAAFAIPYARLRVSRPALPRGGLGMAGLLYVLLLHFMVTLKPEAGIDALSMHLAIPDMIARDGKFAFDFTHYAWSVMPMGGDFAFTSVYMLGGEIAARLLNFAMLAAIAAMVYRGARRWLAPDAAAFSVALFASAPLVQLVTGSLFVENVWAAFLCGATMLLWEGDAVFAAMLFGAAFATKVGTGAFFVPALAVALWGALRRNRDRTLWPALAMLIGFAAPPYLNAWIKTGNPIYPFANNVFHSPYFDSSTPLTDIRYGNPGTGEALYNLAFRSSMHLESQNGALGFQYFILLVPLLLLLNRKAPLAPIAVGVAGAVLTFSSVANLRYLYPAMPMLAVGFAWMMAEMPAVLWAAIPILALNLWFLPSSGWYHNDFAVLVTRARFEAYEKLFAPERKLVDVVNQIAPGEPIAMFQIPAIAGLHAKAYLDAWHTPRFWKALNDATEPAQVADAFRSRGLRYLITPIPAESRQVIASEFVNLWTAPTGRESGKYQLRTLLAAPMPKPRETNPAGPGTYDDLNSSIEYRGAWLHDPQFEKSFEGSLTYSDRPGDTARLFFTGRSIVYVYTMAFNRGVVEVSIDRQPRASLDLYSKETRWRQRTVFAGLDPGPHTIELRVGNEKNPKSRGRFVDIDRLVVSE